MKTVIVLLLIVVIGALASAGLSMLRKPGEGQPAERRDRMARALALRVGLSIALFLFVLLGWWLGWISPGGVPAGR
ncbi:MAG: hypothetical protein RLY78_384 [Pseudomonadota bacterium]|jgi:hypothetical protein|uniref:Twin transmembrane helix small protein n=1 Tax=Pseudaquabacterium rugosum TaxID=2984194 RepID=A0ABU9B4F8_9BURK